MNTHLSGKNALVCGSSRGIGKSVAFELANLGANVTMVARNGTAMANILPELKTANGQKHDFLVADFTDSDDLSKKVKGLSIQKTIHILINNTGGPPPGPITDVTSTDFIEAFHNHLICNHLLVSILSPGMVKAGYGRVINIISTSVKEPIPGLGVSNTIRGAVASWAKTMSQELGSAGITVNNILPGMTRTNRMETLLEKWAMEKGISKLDLEDQFLKTIPLSRFADPSEIANATAFLATPAASYINGVSLAVDGGRMKSI